MQWTVLAIGMIEYDGKTYERDRRGKYRCPNVDCCQWNPDYPAPSWVSDAGFLKHLAQCLITETYTPEPVQEREKFAECPDCGATIWKMTSCWWMGDRIVCLDCYLPYYEAGVGFHAPAGLDLPGITLTL